MSRPILGEDADVACLPGAVVVAGDEAEVLPGVDDVGVGRVGGGVAGLAAAHPVPVGQGDPPREAVAGTRAVPRSCMAPKTR